MHELTIGRFHSFTGGAVLVGSRGFKSLLKTVHYRKQVLRELFNREFTRLHELFGRTTTGVLKICHRTHIKIVVLNHLLLSRLELRFELLRRRLRRFLLGSFSRLVAAPAAAFSGGRLGSAAALMLMIVVIAAFSAAAFALLILFVLIGHFLILFAAALQAAINTADGLYMGTSSMNFKPQR